MSKHILGLDLLKYNFKSIFIYELFYKLFVLLLILPASIGLLNFSLKLAGISYLSYDNIEEFIKNPTTVLVFSLYLIVFSIMFLQEITGLISCFHASYYEIKITSRDILRHGVDSIKRVFKGFNVVLIIGALLLFPILIITQIFSVLYLIKIPDTIANYVDAHQFIVTMIIVSTIITSCFMIRFTYLFYYFTVDTCDMKKKHLKSSLLLMKGSYFSTLIGLLLWNIIIVAIGSIFSIIIIFLIFYCARFIGVDTVNIITIGAYRWSLVLLACIHLLLTIPISFSYISSCYYKSKENKGEIINYYKAPSKIFKNYKTTRMTFVSVILCLSIINLYLIIDNSKALQPNVELFHQTSITAHRGDSVNAPENTLAAIEEAINHFADWVEIDVQQTKDGEIIVMHDSNLKRTSGINRNIWKVNYEEIKELDVGTWFSPEFSDQRIPTLDEAIKLAKGRVKLNIELKPTGHEIDFEKKVIEIIKENNFEDDCVVTSLKYSSLVKIKKIEPKIKTIYVTTVAYGEIANLDSADGFSVEHSFVTKKLVYNIKNKGKDLFVWTVNNEKDLEKMLNIGVDNIITDNPLKAKEMLYSKYAPDKLVEILGNSFIEQGE